MAFGVNAAAVGPTLDRLHASASRPVAVELLNRSAAAAVTKTAETPLPASDPWVIVVGFEEKAVTVAWQVSTLLAELKAAPVRDVAEARGAEAERLWAALAGLPEAAGSPFVVKATNRPSRTATVAAALAAAHPDLLVQAHAGNGVVYGHLSSPDLTPERASAILAAVPSDDGSVTVRRCPPGWKRQLPVWGRPRGDWAVMRTVKQTLDPADVFNPGRLFG